MVENVIHHFTLHCKCRRAYFLHYLLIRLGHKEMKHFVFGLDIKSCDHHIIQWNGHPNFNFTILGFNGWVGWREEGLSTKLYFMPS
jgi:hypothetical protein